MFSLPPGHHGHNRHFGDLWATRPNNRKKDNRRSLRLARQHLAHRRFSPSHLETKAFRHWLPTCLALFPIQYPCDALDFFQNGFSGSRVVLCGGPQKVLGETWFFYFTTSISVWQA